MRPHAFSLFFIASLFLLNSIVAAEGFHSLTKKEYTDFLNHIAASDPHHLYDEKMAIEGGASIFREGTPGNYSYFVKPEEAEQSIAFIDLNSGRRYVNWKQNSHEAPSDDAVVSEHGAYEFEGSQLIATNPEKKYEVAFGHPFSQERFQQIAAVTAIDAELKANHLRLFLHDNSEGNAEESSSHQISSSTGWWIGAGVLCALLAGYGVHRSCLDPHQEEREVARGNEQQGLLSSRTGRSYNSPEPVSASQVREEMQRRRTRFNNYFSDAGIQTMFPNNIQSNRIVNALKRVKRESRQAQNPISCLPRDSGINGFLLTFYRKQLFNSLVREGLKGPEGSEQTAKIVQEINLQRGGPIIFSDCFSLRLIIPGWFSLRHDNPIAKALEDDLEVTSEQQAQILAQVTAARKQLAKPRGSKQGPLSDDPQLREIQERYPYVTDEEAERIAADPEMNPIPPVSRFDRFGRAIGLVQNPEDKIRDRYIHEIVNLTNKAKTKNSYFRKNFFAAEMSKGLVTPMTVTLLRQINNVPIAFPFYLQDSGWITRSLEHDTPMTFEEASKEIKKQAESSLW